MTKTLKILLGILGVLLLILVAASYMKNKVIMDEEVKAVNNEPVKKAEPEPIVVKDFEGEANGDMMTLGMTTWKWNKTLYSDDKLVTPLKENKFTLKFEKDGRFSVTTDCNSMGGQYSVKDKNITFGSMMSTMMYCEVSQEGDFAKMLSETQSYMFTSKGELVLILKMDSGSVYFR